MGDLLWGLPPQSAQESAEKVASHLMLEQKAFPGALNLSHFGHLLGLEMFSQLHAILALSSAPRRLPTALLQTLHFLSRGALFSRQSLHLEVLLS